MAKKEVNDFTNYIGFLFETEKEKWVEFVVEKIGGVKIKFTHRSKKLAHDFLGNKLTKINCYTQLIYIDKVENITIITEGVKLRILKNE
jgi:hypothetical protein